MIPKSIRKEVSLSVFIRPPPSHHQVIFSSNCTHVAGEMQDPFPNSTRSYQLIGDVFWNFNHRFQITFGEVQTNEAHDENPAPLQDAARSSSCPYSRCALVS